MAIAQFPVNQRSNLDVYLPFVRRRVNSVSAGSNVIYVTMVTSAPMIAVGDWVKIQDVSSWANGIWKVTAKNTYTLTLSAPLMTPKSLITLPGTSRGRVIRWATNAVPSNIAKAQTSPDSSFVDQVKLSVKLNYNLTLTGDSTMCATQRRVKDILTQFWKLPAVSREYTIKYNIHKSIWDNPSQNDGYASGGAYNVTRLVNLCMCMIYGASAWRSDSWGGVTRQGLAHDLKIYSFDVNDPSSVYNSPIQLERTYDLSVGLWGITPFWSEFDASAFKTGLRWKNALAFSNTTDSSGKPIWGDFNYLTNPEFSTRVAIATMYESLFNDARHTEAKHLNPFNLFLAGSKNITSPFAFKNSRTQSCYGTNCSKCPPYGVYGTKAC